LRAEASPPLVEAAPGRLTPTDKASSNYSRSGSFGDPTLATLEKGNALLAAMLDDLAEQATSFLAQLSDTGKRVRGAAS
jgi:creatinine amidohydrolase